MLCSIFTSRVLVLFFVSQFADAKTSICSRAVPLSLSLAPKEALVAEISLTSSAIRCSLSSSNFLPSRPVSGPHCPRHARHPARFVRRTRGPIVS